MTANALSTFISFGANCLTTIHVCMQSGSTHAHTQAHTHTHSHAQRHALTYCGISNVSLVILLSLSNTLQAAKGATLASCRQQLLLDGAANGLTLFCAFFLCYPCFHLAHPHAHTHAHIHTHVSLICSC